MLFKNGSKAAEVEPEVVLQPILGTGPMMLMRALGIDPAALTDKLIEFETIIKGAINELVERQRKIDESLAELKAMNQAERMGKNLENISGALSDIAVHLQALQVQRMEAEAGSTAGNVAPVLSTRARRKVN